MNDSLKNINLFIFFFYSALFHVDETGSKITINCKCLLKILILKIKENMIKRIHEALSKSCFLLTVYTLHLQL